MRVIPAARSASRGECCTYGREGSDAHYGVWGFGEAGGIRVSGSEDPHRNSHKTIQDALTTGVLFYKNHLCLSQHSSASRYSNSPIACMTRAPPSKQPVLSGSTLFYVLDRQEWNKGVDTVRNLRQ